MKTFEVLVMAQQYHTVYIDAESIEDAHKQAWDDVGQMITTWRCASKVKLSST